MYNFGAGTLIGVPTNDSTGTAITNPTPVRVAQLQDISIDMSVELKTLYGSGRYPLAVGQGKGKIEIKAKQADFDASVLGSLFLGKTAAGTISAVVLDAVSTIPTTPFQVTISPPSSGTFVADLGVTNASTGATLTRVASGPTTGQYSVNTGTGVYTFASADTGNSVKISYEYTATSAAAKKFALTNDTMGATPAFSAYFSNSYDGKTLAVKFNRMVSAKLALPLKNDDFAIYDFEAEAFADSAGNIGYACLF